jgi:hypothetical protein
VGRLRILPCEKRRFPLSPADHIAALYQALGI